MKGSAPEGITRSPKEGMLQFPADHAHIESRVCFPRPFQIDGDDTPVFREKEVRRSCVPVDNGISRFLKTAPAQPSIPHGQQRGTLRCRKDSSFLKPVHVSFENSSPQVPYRPEIPVRFGMQRMKELSQSGEPQLEGTMFSPVYGFPQKMIQVASRNEFFGHGQTDLDFPGDGTNHRKRKTIETQASYPAPDSGW